MRDYSVSIYYQSCPLDRFRERELLYKGGRAISVNRHRFIHAVVPRHVETVVLLERPLTAWEKYGEYFMNRSAADVMREYGEQHDEWD